MAPGSAVSMRRRSGLAIRSLALLLFVLSPLAAKAVMPMSPQLDNASRLALVKALADAGISETGSSAVLNSLLAVLSTGPASRRNSYRERYPQLPDVDASAKPSGRGCASVALTVRPKAEPRRPVAVQGVYCLSDPARYVWTARSLSAR